MKMHEEKIALRKKAKTILHGLSNKEKSSEAIARRVLTMAEYENANSVFAYLSTPAEPATDAIIADALAKGKRVLVPRCRPNEPGIMDMVEFTVATPIVTGSYGIREPAPDLPAAKAEADCIILPCCAAGENMTRLGHGGGYYDRFLADQSGVKIMLCFDELVFPAVPTDSFDISPDYIVTQTRTLKERTF